jgi:prevent-host-death family protein
MADAPTESYDVGTYPRSCAVETVTVGARELKARLGRYPQVVREGGTVVVTDRGKPIARLTPIAETESFEERTRALVKAGLVQWGGGRLTDREPPATLIGDKTVAGILIEQREREYDWCTTTTPALS